MEQTKRKTNGTEMREAMNKFIERRTKNWVNKPGVTELNAYFTADPQLGAAQAQAEFEEKFAAFMSYAAVFVARTPALLDTLMEAAAQITLAETFADLADALSAKKAQAQPEEQPNGV